MKAFPPFRLDEANQCLWRGQTRIALMPKPFAVLRYLVDHAGILVTHEQLLAAIWPDTYVQPEVLRRYILEIRRALGDPADAPSFIQTFPKRGYQFIAPVADDSVAAAQEPVANGATLVGRSAALADLRGCLTAALQGRRQMIFVVGEPGIGKTSLVDAFQHACTAMPGLAVARGQSVEGFGGKEAYYPLLEAIGQLARRPSSGLVIETLAAIAPTWLVQFPSLIKPDQQSILQREIVGATRERMVRELCEALEVITAKLSLVLILEDLHWVDAPTLDVLSVIARRRERAKLLVVGTVRPTDLILTESPLKALKHDLLLHRLAHEVPLERLQESDVAEYLATAYSPGALPPELASAIYRHSDGNPLFMVAMLDHLAKKNILARADGAWRMTQPIATVDSEVPETLKQMLELQLQHVTDAEQQLLKTASVAGVSFTAWSVAAMLERDAAEIERGCDSLAERQQFVKFSRTRDVSNGVSAAEYRFTHWLYRDVLYRRLNPTQRAALHRRLAGALERLPSSAQPEIAAELALHYEEGQEPAQAVRYLILAAQNATRRYAHQQALSVLEHARELMTRIPRRDAGPLELKILERIGGTYYALGDMARSARAYETMAERAAAAGLLASLADALMRLPHPAELAPFFLKATEIDPNFVSAYTTLSRIYSNLGEAERAKEYAERAYERRDRAAERDRLSITYQYHYEVTGDQVQACATLELWKRAFPLDFQPVNSLALLHNFLGQFDRAIEEGQDAVGRNPVHGYPYSNLAHAFRGAGRFDEARTIAEEAVTRQIETLPTRRLLYQLAVLAGDEATATRHLEWARDKPREFDMIGAHAQVAAWSGKVREARRLYEEAADLADRRNLPDVGSSHLAWGISMELAFENTAAAADLARRVLSRHASYDSRLRAAVALGACAPGEAEELASRLAAENPQHTLINKVLVPMVRSAIALGRNDPRDAIGALEIVAPYELGFIAALTPVHLRGQAHLRLGEPARAVADFQRILDCRGSDPFSPFHAVAAVGLARAYALAGAIGDSRRCYEQFLTAWSAADPDIPILRAAAHESSALEQPH